MKARIGKEYAHGTPTAHLPAAQGQTPAWKLAFPEAMGTKQRSSEPPGLGKKGRRQSQHWGTFCLPEGVLKAGSRNWPARGASAVSKGPDAIQAEEPGQLIYYQTDATSRTCLKNTLNVITSEHSVKSKSGWGLVVPAQLPALRPGLSSRPTSKTCFLTARTFLPAAFPALGISSVCFKNESFAASSENTTSPGLPAALVS